LQICSHAFFIRIIDFPQEIDFDERTLNDCDLKIQLSAILAVIPKTKKLNCLFINNPVEQRNLFIYHTTSDICPVGILKFNIALCQQVFDFIYLVIKLLNFFI